jgi:hypothetical protein
MQYSDPTKTEEALLALGCMELKDFVKQSPYGSCFYTAQEWQLSKLESGTPFKMSGYWRFENGNGATIVLHGDQLVFPTENQPIPSIYAQHGLDKKRHDQILLKSMGEK